MRALRYIAAAALLLAVAGAGCSGKHAEKDNSIHILTTFLPVYQFTQQLAGDLPDVTIEMIAPANAGCPSDYSLTPANLRQVTNADIIVQHGLGIDSFFAPKAAKKANPTATWIRLSDGLDSLKLAKLEGEPPPDLVGEDRHHHHHGHDALPHAWVAPSLASEEVSFLAQRLAAAIPAHRDTILARSAEFTSWIDGLGEEFRAVADSADNRRVVFFHDSFTLFAHDIGLQVVAVIQTNPDVEPGPRELHTILDAIRSGDVAAVFSEPQLRPDLAKTISSETGMKVYILDPDVTGSTERGGYIRDMEMNLRVLRTALLGSR